LGEACRARFFLIRPIAAPTPARPGTRRVFVFADDPNPNAPSPRNSIPFGPPSGYRPPAGERYLRIEYQVVNDTCLFFAHLSGAGLKPRNQYSVDRAPIFQYSIDPRSHDPAPPSDGGTKKSDLPGRNGPPFSLPPGPRKPSTSPRQNLPTAWSRGAPPINRWFGGRKKSPPATASFFMSFGT